MIPISSVTITVDEIDIAEGTQCCSRSCPVAKALEEAFTFNGFKPFKVEVDQSWMKVFKCFGVAICSHTPCTVSRFIQSYDQKGKAQPFDFQLPEELLYFFNQIHRGDYANA